MSYEPVYPAAYYPTGDSDGADVDAQPPRKPLAPRIVAPLPAATARMWPAPLDQAAWHGLAGEIVDAVREHTEADEVGLLGTLLALFGVVVGDRRSIHVGSAQGGNLYVALAGETASGRKGTSLSVVSTLFDAAYPAWRMLQVAGLGSGEGLVGWLKRREGTEHRALVLETELGRLLGVMTRDGSTLSPVVRAAWDGTAIGRNLARDDWLVTEHHVGLLAHVTPAELRERLTDGDAANGFGNRFLWLAVRRTRLVALPESPRGLFSGLVGPLRRAIDAAHQPAELEFTETAAERWRALYEERAEIPRHGLSGALTARGETQTIRLALLYAMLDRSAAVDLPHLAAAEAVWSYAERSVRYLFGDSTGNELADFIRGFLRDGPATRDELRQETGQRDATRLAKAIDLLVDLGIARVGKGESSRRGGRRPVVVELLRAPYAETTLTDGEFPQFPQFPPGAPATAQAQNDARPIRGNVSNWVSRVIAGPPVGNDGNDANSPAPDDSEPEEELLAQLRLEDTP